MRGDREVEWKEVRRWGDGPPEPFLVKAEWTDDGWEFFDRSLMDLAGIYRPIATTSDLVGRAEREWALQSVDNDDVIGERPVTAREPAFVGLAGSQHDQKGSSHTRRDVSVIARDRQLLPDVSLRS